MNFDYIKDAQPKTEQLKKLYDCLYKNLREAEELYWSRPQKSGMLLRKAAENICRIYNSYYEIGFSEDAGLEDYLCYTADDSHNVMVSRFLSVIRKEQRDHLEWLRVWGDECVFMEVNPDETDHNADRIYLNVKKMMVSMLDVTREMCEKLDHMKNLEKRIFEDRILPGYQTEEEIRELEKQHEKEEKEKNGIFRRFLCRILN